MGGTKINSIIMIMIMMIIIINKGSLCYYDSTLVWSILGLKSSVSKECVIVSLERPCKCAKLT